VLFGVKRVVHFLKFILFVQYSFLASFSKSSSLSKQCAPKIHNGITARNNHSPIGFSPAKYSKIIRKAVPNKIRSPPSKPMPAPICQIVQFLTTISRLLIFEKRFSDAPAKGFAIFFSLVIKKEYDRGNKDSVKDL
jgi:hypothetical protein